MLVLQPRTFVQSLVVPLPLQVNGNTMVDVTHDEAVAVLKATQVKVLLTIEKNAISSTTEPGEEVSTTCSFNLQLCSITSFSVRIRKAILLWLN